MARLPAPGEVAEWLKAADCKSARVSRTLVRIQPSPPLQNGGFPPFVARKSANSQLASVSQRILIFGGHWMRL
jgi:hypothetical protein